MDKVDLSTRIINIAKGKIAEGLFYHYCKEHQISVDTQSCSTPFWTADLRDFLWLGGEWDIKNNFFYCSDVDFPFFDFTRLPALIPYKYDGDQWSKRHETYHVSSKFTAFLFTFMRLRPEQKHFINIQLSKEQMDFITSVSANHNLRGHWDVPFSEAWFYNELEQRGSTDYFSLSYHPELIITACANARHWTLFKETSVNSKCHYQDGLGQHPWYQKTNTILKFMDGALITKIKNQTCPVSLLPSFASIVSKWEAGRTSI